ncbi:hypothetical protein EON83_28220 [bacterium]|nr:MAG: hypothetical protein EON83_28220 [bacterium]
MKILLLPALVLVSGCVSSPVGQPMGPNSPLPATVAVPEKQRVATLFAVLSVEVKPYPDSTKALEKLKAQYDSQSNTEEGLRLINVSTQSQYIEVPFAPNAQKVKQLLRQLEKAVIDQYKAADLYVNSQPQQHMPE